MRGSTDHRGRAECADSSTPLSKGRAVCGSSARTDLCGGRFVRIVPTATPNSFVRTSLLRNSPCDRCWSEGDRKPQVFGFLLEPLDLLVLITLLIRFHPFVYVLLAVFEHAIDQQ